MSLHTVSGRPAAGSCLSAFLITFGLAWGTAQAQLVDITQTPNSANAGIKKSLADQVGAGRGDVNTPGTSAFIIARDPARAVVRGQRLFQRKFLHAQGQGPLVQDGVGDIENILALGAGLGDSCAICHGRPRGSAGVGGNVVTRPDSRDAPHLFGLGLQEMLADEITRDLRDIRDNAIVDAMAGGSDVTRALHSKGIDYGSITAHADGSVDTSDVEGVNPDLRVRPFFAQGGTISMREFIVGAFQAEMGLQSADADLAAAVGGAQVTTPSGMVLDGAFDAIEGPTSPSPGADPDGDGVSDEINTALVDFMEFYLLNYFKPGRGQRTPEVRFGERLFDFVGCDSCHIPDLVIDEDRRVADVETEYDPRDGIFNRLFATATPLFVEVDDGSGHPTLKQPALGPFLVEDIYTDFKRHDLGPNFWERNYDGTLQKEFMTEPLWGAGTTAPYGHDGRSINLREVILRHGGEAQRSRDKFARLPSLLKAQIEAFLSSLILFGPPDTASNLNPGDPSHPDFPQSGHGSIDLSVLFNDPGDKE